MPIAQKWDRAHDLFTVGHVSSHKPHLRMGTIQERINGTVDARGSMMGRFIEPLAEMMG